MSSFCLKYIIISLVLPNVCDYVVFVSPYCSLICYLDITVHPCLLIHLHIVASSTYFVISKSVMKSFIYTIKVTSPKRVTCGTPAFICFHSHVVLPIASLGRRNLWSSISKDFQQCTVELPFTECAQVCVCGGIGGYRICGG